MDRRKFLNDVSLTVALACTGCLAACSKNDDDNPGPDGIDPVTFNLSNELLNTGDSVKRSGVIIVRLNTGNTPGAFAALSSACTHEGSFVDYNSSQEKFICPNHGSQFSTSGAVLQGPADRSLTQYTITIEGNTLTVR